jgi:DNA gyrase subunit A
MSEEVEKTSEERILRLDIEKEMKSAYIDYSMSVIVSRALPDARDGMKPVHRRVLFGMSKMGNTPDQPYKKSARIVGEVMGKFHPHGDSSIYGTLVHLAQPWNMRYPLVDGQGNFGSIDGDSPAAMRYTEARMQKIAVEALADLEKDTVDMTPNFSQEYLEPSVLPTRIPLLLVNGCAGIAVGMATNMAPHNLSDSVDAIIAYIDNNDITISELSAIIKAPDFPTGGTIYGYQGVLDAYETGQGRIVVRAKARFETENGRDLIVVDEIPYLVNKAELIKRTADLINDKKIEGISEVNDESDKDGMRIVYTLKKDAVPNIVLNKLYKYTYLQSSFSVNNVALVDGRPKTINLKDMIKVFTEHRHEVIVRRTKFDLKEAEKRAHILEGLIIACDNIDEVVHIIRASKNVGEARENLMKRFSLDEDQANAIVEMRLRQLTGLQMDQLHAEYEELEKRIAYYRDVLANYDMQMQIVKDELIEVKEKYGDERKTDIVKMADEFNPEDFYADEDVVIAISHLGYIKRTALTEYKLQNRGGVGSRGGDARDTDYIEHLYIANMHATMLIFTEQGRCFWQKVYDIPEGTKTSKGRAIQNILNISNEDKVKTYVTVDNLTEDDYIKNHYVVLCTENGIIKKTTLEAYSRPRQNGIIALSIREGDSLLQACLTDGNCEILMAIQSGKAIRFPESKFRAMGRTASGVKGITVPDGENVVGLICVPADTKKEILVVSENGYGKRSKVDDYRVTNRGGKGVKTLNVTDKTGKLVAFEAVDDDDDLMIMNKSGLTIRMEVSSLRVMGRVAQGVKLINLRTQDSIAAISTVHVDPEDRQANAEMTEEDTDSEQSEQTENQDETNTENNE